MKYNINMLVKVAETPVLRCNLIAGLSGGSRKMYEFCLTEKKLIFSAENDLRTFPLNQVTELFINDTDSNVVGFFCGGRVFSISLPADRMMAEKIVYEIAKRIGH